MFSPRRQCCGKTAEAADFCRYSIRRRNTGKTCYTFVLPEEDSRRRCDQWSMGFVYRGSTTHAASANIVRREIISTGIGNRGKCKMCPRPNVICSVCNHELVRKKKTDKKQKKKTPRKDTLGVEIYANVILDLDRGWYFPWAPAAGW